MQQPENPTSEPKLCFILGIRQRSGTNYLFRLLTEHAECTGPGPLWEDYFVRHSQNLNNYTDSLYNTWNPTWDVANKIGPKETLLNYFGDAISRFLKLQLRQDNAEQSTKGQDASKKTTPKILLTKTPSVENLDNFFDLFPNAYLIIIIRDGRAVVESGVRSFNWNYEDATRKWRDGARSIIDLQGKYKNTNKKFLIIKYEDLFTDEKTELNRAFEYLEIDPTKFDFSSVQDLGITGSSEVKKKADAVHWQVTKKEKKFNPLARFSNWNRKKHDRFNWIAGSYMKKLGYTLEDSNSNTRLYEIKNKLLDSIWKIKTKYFVQFDISRRITVKIKQLFLKKTK